ncbi:hypothetical protein IJG91_01445 [Candidatus Saccharibacteria bacterium]|nr:hypothetical protein [Candidatus Saccharibacteria bacterium]
MRRDYNEEVKQVIRELTGMTDDILDCVTGAIYATVFLGAFPGKDDLMEYLGTNRSTMEKLLREAADTAIDSNSPYWDWMGPDIILPRPGVAEYIYPLATEMVARGLWLEGKEEPTERLVARTFLEAFCPSTKVKNKDLFQGYNIVLDYLHFVQDESEEIRIGKFIGLRYEYMPRAAAKVEQICLTLAQANPHIFDPIGTSSREVCNYLAKGVKEAQKKAVANGSARLGKARVEVAIKLDQKETGMSHTSRMMAAMIP